MRHEDEIQRALRSLRAAAYSVVSAGGTPEEAEEAMRAGLAAIQERLDRHNRPAPAPRPAAHTLRHSTESASILGSPADRLWAAMGRAS